MNTAALLAYAAALVVAVVIPGPAALAVISTGIASGARRANLLACGIAAGDVVLSAVALTGLAVLALSFGWVFALVKYAGAACLIWLGIRMWRAPVTAVLPEPGSGGGLRPLALGLAVALGNPKAILFHASLMPLIVDIPALSWAEIAAVLTIVAAVNLAVMTAYGNFAGSASRWFHRPGLRRLLNRAGGGAMVGTGALIAAP